MNKVFSNPIILAVDSSSISEAETLASDLKDYIGGIKLGMEFFNSFGPEGVKTIKKLNIPIFLDLKLHDIPITVYKTVKSLLDLEPAIINVHASGGKEMMMAASRALKESNNVKTKIIAVTVLTSLDNNDLKEIGFDEKSDTLVVKLANLVKDSGLDGIVCSAKEISLVRKSIGDDFILVVPGIRLHKDKLNDQKRVMSPKEAISLGADLLVIGRPITNAENKIKATKEILSQIK